METYSFEPALDKISPYPGRAAYPELMWVDDAAHQMSATGNAEGRRPAVDMRLTQVGGVALRITQGIASEADDILYRVFHDGVPAQPDARSDSSSLGIVDGASELSQPSPEPVERLESLRVAEVIALDKQRQKFALQLSEVTRRQAA